MSHKRKRTVSPPRAPPPPHAAAAAAATAAAAAADTEGTAASPLHTSLPTRTSESPQYRVIRRVPNAVSAGARSVHVSRRTNLHALQKRITRLLARSDERVALHAMGAAIAKCCQLALRVQRAAHGAVALHVDTSTQVVHDDYHPLVEGVDMFTKSRSVSAVHVSLRRTSRFV